VLRRLAEDVGQHAKKMDADILVKAARPHGVAYPRHVVPFAARRHPGEIDKFFRAIR
jgi:hypothetical protein